MTAALAILTLQFVLAGFFTALAYIYWKKDSLFISIYSKFNKTINDTIAFGISYRQAHRIAAGAFGALAVAAILIAVLVLNSMLNS